MERVFINRELDAIGVGKPMMVDTGNRELRRLSAKGGELEVRPKGKTIEYRYKAKEADYKVIYV